MPYLKTALAIVAILIFVSSGASQNRSRSFVAGKVKAKEPGSSIQFVSYQDYVSKRNGEKLKLAQLRLRNNMKFPIKFCGYDASLSPNQKPGPHYELERIMDSSNPETRDNSKVPFGMIGHSICRAYTVRSNQSFEFAIVVNEFDPNTQIKIAIFYPWEDVYESISGKEPSHYVYFQLIGLP